VSLSQAPAGATARRCKRAIPAASTASTQTHPKATQPSIQPPPQNKGPHLGLLIRILQVARQRGWPHPFLVYPSDRVCHRPLPFRAVLAVADGALRVLLGVDQRHHHAVCSEAVVDASAVWFVWFVLFWVGRGWFSGSAANKASRGAIMQRERRARLPSRFIPHAKHLPTAYSSACCIPYLSSGPPTLTIRLAVPALVAASRSCSRE